MELRATIGELGLTEFEPALAVAWEAAQAALPPNGPFFLKPAFVAEACRATFLPAEPMAAALAGAERIAATEALRALAWYCYWNLWENPDFPAGGQAAWPPLERVTAERRGDLAMIYLLAMIARYPQMQAVHAAHDVDPAIVEHTLLDLQLGGWTALHERHGVWGLDVPRLHWLQYHLRGEIYRLGRLQFQYGKFAGRLRMYQHRETGKVVALSESGVRYLADGRLWSEAREAPGQESWVAELTTARAQSDDPACALRGATVIGNPITPQGVALREPVELPCAEWWQLLEPGDPVLHLHIPVGGPMDFAECGESLRWAARWFPEHFPEWPFLAYCCNSWLLDTQLQEFLAPDSNIVRFQREMYLYPTITSDENLLGPILHCMPEFSAAQPRETALQRALVAYLAAGNQLRSSGGGSIILAEDLDWGSQIYQREGSGE